MATYKISQLEAQWGHSVEEWGFDPQALTGYAEARHWDDEYAIGARVTVELRNGAEAMVEHAPIPWQSLPTHDAHGQSVREVVNAIKYADDMAKRRSERGRWPHPFARQWE